MSTRTFIAAEISDSVRQELSELQQKLKESEADVKWVTTENMHITMKFLGATEEEKIKKIKETLNTIANKTESFKIGLGGLGVFPKINYPRIIWTGLDKGAEEITNLALKIEESLTALGFSKDKYPFSAHLTLGRVRSLKNNDKLKNLIINMFDIKLKNVFLLDKVILFKSELNEVKPIYTALDRFYLRGCNATE